MSEFNVLSLFDGISCGQVALNRAGIKYDNYFASEIDKHAIKVTQANYPNTIQLGDITKWKEWNLPRIDLICGGSPCTNLSTAGDKTGLDGNQSKLFYYFVDILNHYKPRYFLFENVRMKKEYSDKITQLLGVPFLEINSSLVSGQNRKRLYWANFPIKLPEDRGITFDKVLYRLPHGYIKEGIKAYNKYPALAAQSPGTKYKIIENYKLSEYAHSRIKERKGEKDGLLYSWYNDKIHNEKSPTLTSNCQIWSATGGITVLVNKSEFRTLTPEECEELQTLPIGWTKELKKTQRYKAIGNGWTVDVITHILSYIYGTT